jgi:hypothetical protein
VTEADRGRDDHAAVGSDEVVCDIDRGKHPDARPGQV